jgi:prevent-host-death family protein
MVMTMVKSKKPRTMSVSEFRAKCLALMDEVAETGVPIVLTRRGVPVGEIEPATPEDQRLFDEGKLEEWKPPARRRRTKSGARR